MEDIVYSNAKEHVVRTPGGLSAEIGSSRTRHLLLAEPRGFEEDEVPGMARTELVVTEE